MATVSAVVLRRLRLAVKRIARLRGLARPIARLWNTYEHIKFQYSIWRNLREQKLTATIDPYHVFHISPIDIRKLTDSSFDFVTDTALVQQGDWDQSTVALRRYSIYCLFEQRFQNGLDWQDTEYYKRVSKKIQQGNSVRYATLPEFEEKLRLYDRLYEEFREGNYKLQSELVAGSPHSPPGTGGRALFPSVTDKSLIRHEIAVHIGRNGRFLIGDGRHRVCLAHIADLEAVPVRVVVRHAKWQKLRDDVARTIDEALEKDISQAEIRDYVAEALQDELADIHRGIDHPDIEVIFERRLSDQ